MQTFMKTIVDFECLVFFMNEFYLRAVLPNEKSISMTAPMNVKEIENAVDEFINYIIVDIYFDGISEKTSARNHIRKKFHLIKKLKCKVFLNMSILAVEQITINIIEKMMIIFTCKNLVVFIKIVPKPNARIRRIVHFKNQTLISTKTIIRIFTYMKKKNS